MTEAQALAEAIAAGAYSMPVDDLVAATEAMRALIEPAGHDFPPASLGCTTCSRCGLSISVATAYLAAEPCTGNDD